MNQWPQRTVFKEALASYKAKHGLKQTALAQILGIELSTLQTYLYGKKGRPSLDLLQRVSALTGTSIKYFIDDPGTDTLGAASDEETRFLSQLIIKDLNASDLSPEDKKALYDAWRWNLETIRRARKDPGPAR